MRTLVDFHSHILPGMDDGSKSLEESIAMLRMEAKQGIQHVVATPHFYANHDTPERFRKRRDRAEALLREEMEKHSGLPRLSVGAEVHFFKGISDSDAISALTIAQKKCILIEMMPSPWGDSAYRELEDLYERHGLVPILAHLDRYISRFRTFGIPRRLEELPVLVQANAEFFLNRSTSSMALRMLREDRIHLLGSDCHNMKSRKPDLGAALVSIRKHLGEAALARINSYEQNVLEEDW